MKIFNSLQIKKADAYTITQKSMSNWELMESAAKNLCSYLCKHFSKKKKFYIFCGPGNNGGDGLVLARLLFLKGRNVEIFRDCESLQISPSAKINLDRLNKFSGIKINDFSELDSFLNVFLFSKTSFLNPTGFSANIFKYSSNTFVLLVLKKT